jgi:hypothetical protein
MPIKFLPAAAGFKPRSGKNRAGTAKKISFEKAHHLCNIKSGKYKSGLFYETE